MQVEGIHLLTLTIRAYCWVIVSRVSVTSARVCARVAMWTRSYVRQHDYYTLADRHPSGDNTCLLVICRKKCLCLGPYEPALHPAPHPVSVIPPSSSPSTADHCPDRTPLPDAPKLPALRRNPVCLVARYGFPSHKLPEF